MTHYGIDMQHLQDGYGLLSNLQIYKFTFRLRASSAIKLPPYKGATFKGVFGHQLKKTFCSAPNISNCRECPVFDKCAYVYLYESPLPRGSQILGGTLDKSEFSPSLLAALLEREIIRPNSNNPQRVRFDARLIDEAQLGKSLGQAGVGETEEALRLWRKSQVKKDIFPPLILEPPLSVKEDFVAGDSFELGLVLIGKAIDYLPFLLLVFMEIGKSGIGKQIHQTDKGWKKGGIFSIAEVRDAISGGLVYSENTAGQMFDNYAPFTWKQALTLTEQPVSASLSLRFLTPARIKEDKHLLDKFSGFGQFISHLYWRLILLAYFHSNPWNISDERFADLGEDISRLREEFHRQADNDVKLQQSCNWREFRRWSNRQDDEMLLGGFMGEMELSGDLTIYLPLLYLGQLTHLGKQTTFGLGKYEIITPTETA